MSKISDLAEVEGMDVMEMLERAVMDGRSPGICMNEGCNYTTEVEPDQNAGHCESCNTQTVKSCLILAGMI